MSIRGLVSELPTNKEVLYSGTLWRLQLLIRNDTTTTSPMRRIEYKAEPSSQEDL